MGIYIDINKLVNSEDNMGLSLEIKNVDTLLKGNSLWEFRSL